MGLVLVGFGIWVGPSIASRWRAVNGLAPLDEEEDGGKKGLPLGGGGAMYGRRCNGLADTPDDPADRRNSYSVVWERLVRLNPVLSSRGGAISLQHTGSGENTNSGSK